MISSKKKLTVEERAKLCEDTYSNLLKQRERSRNAYVRKEMIRNEVEEIDQPIISAIKAGTEAGNVRAITNSQHISDLNKTVNRLNETMNKLTFSQIPAITGNDESIITYPESVIPQVEEEEEEVFKTPLETPVKSQKSNKTKTLQYDLDKLFENSDDLFITFKDLQKPTKLYQDYTEKISKNIISKDDAIYELNLIIDSLSKKSKSIGGKMKGTKEDSKQRKLLERHVEFLQKYRNSINMMKDGINMLVVSGTGVFYMNLDDLVKRLYILLQHKIGGNNSDLLYNEANDILEILLKNKVIKKSEHKKLFNKFKLSK